LIRAPPSALPNTLAGTLTYALGRTVFIIITTFISTPRTSSTRYSRYRISRGRDRRKGGRGNSIKLRRCRISQSRCEWSKPPLMEPQKCAWICRITIRRLLG
jgi:hypothetical protein